MNEHGGRVAAALALGLFLSRALSELLVFGTGWAPEGLSLFAALVLALVVTAAAGWGLGRVKLVHSWPLCFLFIYIFHGEPNPLLALSTAAITLLIYLLRRLDGHVKQHITADQVIWPLFLFVGFFVLYAATIAPGVLPADSGEFQVVAANLGVAHPPGFSLYTLLAHLATLVPLDVTPALKINLLSAGISALTLVLIYATLLRLTRRPLPGVVASVALGTSTTFWSQATTSNIRSLTALFAAMAFYLLVKFAHENGARSRQPGSQAHSIPDTAVQKRDAILPWLALVIVAGVTHHASLVFMSIVFLAYILLVDRGLLKTPRRWLRPLAVGVAGLIPLLYIPWRGASAQAGAAIRGASAGLASLSGFLDHILARGFRGDFFYFVQPAELWERIKLMGNVMEFQFSSLLLLGMVLGLLLMLRRQPRLALLLGGSFLVHGFVTATYRAPQTVEYMMPAYIPAVIALGYLTGQGHQLLGGAKKPLALASSHAFTAVFLTAALAQGISHYPSYRALHRDTTAGSYAQLLLAEAPAQAIILADWHWATPLWYLQEVEDLRPDVDVAYVFPTSEPYAQTWARRISEEYASGRAVISTHYDEDAYASLPVPEPVGEAWLYQLQPRTSIPPDFTPLDLNLGDTILVAGYFLTEAPVEIGRETTLTLAWRPLSPLPEPTSLFAHLVGIDGRLYGQHDTQAVPRSEGLTLTRFYLTPRIGTMPGDFAIMVGAYNSGTLTSPDGQARITIATLPVKHMSQPLFTGNHTYRLAPGGRLLVGYDWDNTLPEQSRLYLHWCTEHGCVTEIQTHESLNDAALVDLPGAWGVRQRHPARAGAQPGHYVPLGDGIVWTGPLLDTSQPIKPGLSIYLRQSLHSSWPVTRDLATSVRLIGYEEDGFHWAWWDLDDAFGVPAMGGIPTLKWTAGVTIRDPHRLTVADSAYPGQTVGAALGLYETFTGRPLPVLDERFTRETAWRLTTVSP